MKRSQRKHALCLAVANVKKILKNRGWILMWEITEHENLKEIKLPLKPKQLQQLQKNDTYCREVAKKLHKDMELQKIFIKEEGVLYRLWIEDGRTFKCILVPQVLQDSMIILVHDYSSHNSQEGLTIV